METMRSKVNELRTALTAGTVPSRSIDFALSLVAQFDKKGELSEKQMYWVEKLAAGPASNEPISVPDACGIFDMFDRVELKYPKITLRLEDGTGFKIGRAGDRSKYCGQLILTDGTRDKNNYFGRVTEEGQVYLSGKGSQYKDEILETLMELGANPEVIAATHGKVTGNCCFCNRPLSNDRSLEVGYGKTCAERYDLEW